MFIWQYIDVPEEEVLTVQQLVRDNLPDNGEFFQYLDIGLKTFLGAEVDIAVLIQASPGFGLDGFGIHRDAGAEEGQCLAINIPLENCDNSVTKFWKTSKPEIKQFTPNGIPYNYFEMDGCEQIDEFVLSRPIIFNTSVPHLVVNPQDVWRKAISIRFKTDPWDLIKKD
jgi:hypothetical protein